MSALSTRITCCLSHHTTHQRRRTNMRKSPNMRLKANWCVFLFRRNQSLSVWIVDQEHTHQCSCDLVAHLFHFRLYTLVCKSAYVLCMYTTYTFWSKGRHPTHSQPLQPFRAAILLGRMRSNKSRNVVRSRSSAVYDVSAFHYSKKQPTKNKLLNIKHIYTNPFLQFSTASYYDYL